MYWLVETKDQLTELRNSGYKKAYFDVIGVDRRLHPAENRVSAIYIRPLAATKGFMIPVSHTESTNVNINEVIQILQNYEVLFCYDSKKLLHYFSLQSIHDCVLAPDTFDPSVTVTHRIFEKRFPTERNLNRIIPIVKHYEACQSDYEQIRSRLNKNNTKYERFYNEKVSLVYHNIERSSLGIDTDIFFKHFYNREKPYVYTQYNLNTVTTRPSNKHGGVNYAALNKKTGERSSFVPRNDYFAEFDVVAYHPVIVSQIIGYEFKNKDVHQDFAEMYGVERDKAKELTFQQFYGRIFAKYKDLTYFRLLLGKQDELITQYEDQGFIEEPISGHRFEKKDLGEINKEKLFNYFLQATETSINVEILLEIQDILKEAQTRIVLTVYDSFLFDVKKGEEKLLERIQSVFKNKKLNTTIKSGYDYNFK